MLLKSKDIAYVSVMTAISVLILVISGYIESSTLFFLAAAAFLTGVVEDRLGVIPAVFHVLCTVIIGLIMSPQKLYCITYTCFGVYVIVAEYIEEYRKKGKNGWLLRLSWFIKCCVFEVMLFVIIAVYGQLAGISALFPEKLTHYPGSDTILMIVLILVAQAAWIVFDRAYVYFMKRYGRKLSTKGS